MPQHYTNRAEPISSGCWAQRLLGRANVQLGLRGRGCKHWKAEEKEKLGSTGEHLADLSITFSFLKSVQYSAGRERGRWRDKWTNPAFSYSLLESLPSPGAGEVASSREHVVTLPSSCNYWPMHSEQGDEEQTEPRLSKLIFRRDWLKISDREQLQTLPHCPGLQSMVRKEKNPPFLFTQSFGQCCIHSLIYILTRK